MRILCDPSVSPLSCTGLEHAAKTASSTEHTNVAASPAVNVNVGEVLLLGSPGAPVIETTGPLVSTVQVVVAEPLLPRGSLPDTTRVWLPSVSPDRVNGLPHAAK